MKNRLFGSALVLILACSLVALAQRHQPSQPKMVSKVTLQCKPSASQMPVATLAYVKNTGGSVIPKSTLVYFKTDLGINGKTATSKEIQLNETFTVLDPVYKGDSNCTAWYYKSN
jgi:hypothetical protein